MDGTAELRLKVYDFGGDLNTWSFCGVSDQVAASLSPMQFLKTQHE